MKASFSAFNSKTLASELAALAAASRADLTSRWRTLYKTEPPGRISRELLKRAIAYRLQELALRGLKPATRRLLAKVAADASARKPLELAPRPNPVRTNIVTSLCGRTGHPLSCTIPDQHWRHMAT